MFGYVVVDQPEMRFKDYYLYRSYYCGLCRDIKRIYGNAARLGLTYDMTFLAVLLDGLYDSEEGTAVEKFRCVAHPVRKRTSRRNAFTEYAAHMTTLLTYYKCMDDWADEHKLLRLLYGRLIRGKALRAAALYPEKARVIKDELSELSRLEKQYREAWGNPAAGSGAGVACSGAGVACTDSGSGDPVTDPGGELPWYEQAENTSSCFGRMMAEIASYKKDDVWDEKLRVTGFYLGKYIYLLDAYDDVFEDIKKGCYNPFKAISSEPDFDEKAEEVLRLAIAGSAGAFEYLPFDENAEILRNIMYSGVWNRFESIRKKRREDEDK